MRSIIRNQHICTLLSVCLHFYQWLFITFALLHCCKIGSYIKCFDMTVITTMPCDVRFHADLLECIFKSFESKCLKAMERNVLYWKNATAALSAGTNSHFSSSSQQSLHSVVRLHCMDYCSLRCNSCLFAMFWPHFLRYFIMKMQCLPWVTSKRSSIFPRESSFTHEMLRFDLENAQLSMLKCETYFIINFQRLVSCWTSAAHLIAFCNQFMWND